MLESDVAAVLDVLTGASPQTVSTPQGALAPLTASLSQQAKMTLITFSAHTQYTSTFQSEFLVGSPFQGNMRQLAFDRWNFMYPS